MSMTEGWGGAEDAYAPDGSDAPIRDVASDCPSCGGLNTSHPKGCGRGSRTGELDGSTLVNPASEVERVARIEDELICCSKRFGELGKKPTWRDLAQAIAALEATPNARVVELEEFAADIRTRMATVELGDEPVLHVFDRCVAAALSNKG